MDIKNIKDMLRKFKLVVLFGNAVIKFITVISLGLIICLPLDYYIFFPGIVRSILFILTIGIGVFFVSKFKFNPVALLENQQFTNDEKFNGRLFAAVYKYPAELGYSEELINKVREDAWQILNSINLWQVAKKHLNPVPLLISIFALIVCISIIPAPKYLWVKRFFLPQNKFLALAISPGDIKLPYGNNVEIKVIPNGILPRKLTLITGDNYIYTLYRNEGYKKILALTHSFSYYARLRDVSSDTHNVSILVQPWIKEFKLTYIYPEYTKLSPFVSTLPEISALQGTRIKFTAVANEKLESGKIKFGVQKEIETKIRKDTLYAEFTVMQPDSYQMYLIAKSGLQTSIPESYAISIWKDKFPEVEIIYPGFDMEMPPNMKLPLAVHISDDFGFYKIKLVSDKGEWVIRLGGDLPTDTVITYIWDVSQISLLPGEAIKYWVEVQDNDKFNGYKVGKSSEFKLYFPTVEDIYKEVTKEINETQNTAVTELEKALDNLNSVDKQLESITKKDTLNWYDKQSLKNIMQKEKSIAKEMQKLSEDIDKLYKSAENTMIVDKELMTKLEELKNLFSELKLKELDEAIRKIEETLAKKPELMAEAMKKFNLTQEEFKQRIENTLELLKKYKQEQTLAALADKAAELKEWQEKINEKTAKSDMNAKNKQELSSEEQALGKELEQLAKDIDKLAKGLDNKDLANEFSRANKTQPKVSKSANALAKGQKPSRMQSEITQELSDLSSGLSSIYRKMLDQRKSELAKEINKMKNDFLFLSFEEEQIPANSGLEAAFKQEALIKGAKSSTEDLSSAIKNSPFISGDISEQANDALKHMESAKRSFESRKTAEGKTSQSQAMAKLNEIVVSLMNAEQALQASACASGMPELLQQLAQITKDQQALNQLCQSLFPFSMSQSSMGEQLSELMEKQSVLGKALEEIAGGLKGKTLGDMGDMAQDMEKIAKDMQAGITKDIVERQNKLLNHLLDAQKSIYTRKYSRQRIAEPGENLQLPSPSEPDMLTKRGVSQKAIIEALKKEYPKEYEQLIRAYFKALSTE